MTTRTPEATDEVLEYLDEWREAGEVKMLRFSAYLERDYALTQREARAVLSYWMSTFGGER